MGLGHCKGGRAAGQRDKVVIRPFAVKSLTKWEIYGRKYCPLSKERARELGKEFRARNPDYMKNYCREWRKKQKAKQLTQ